MDRLATYLGMLTTRLKDGEGIIANHEEFFTFDDTSTMAQVKTFSDAYLAVLDPMTECEVVNQAFRVVLGFSGLKGAPVADSDVQETLLLSFDQNGTFSRWGDDIPGYIDSINVNGRIDLTNATLVAYAAFQDTTTGVGRPAGRIGNALIALYSGVETFRKKRRALNARSRTISLSG